MREVKIQLNRLESKLGSFLGLGDSSVRSKINAIKKAVCAVELADREQVFSNEQSPECNQVRVALAIRRYAVSDTAMANGKIDTTKPEQLATSFQELHQRFKNTVKEVKAEEPAQEQTQHKINH